MNSQKISWILLTLTLLVGTANLYASSPEFGKAHYYADKFHGKKTSSGELYDRTLYTCAHKTYPFGTILRVTRLDNDMSVEVRVNDRGPHAEGFVVDISYAAALDIDLVKAGVANVKVELVEKETSGTEKTVVPATEKVVKPATLSKEGSQQAAKPAPKTVQTAKGGITVIKSQDGEVAPSPKAQTPKTAQAPVKVIEKPKAEKIKETYKVGATKTRPGGFGVQILALTNADNLMKETAKLEATWPGKVLVNVEADPEIPGSATYKLLIGSYATKKEAEAQQKIATKKGHAKCFVVEIK